MVCVCVVFIAYETNWCVRMYLCMCVRDRTRRHGYWWLALYYYAVMEPLYKVTPESVCFTTTSFLANV